MPAPLADLLTEIPPRVRKRIYQGFSVAGVVVQALNIGGIDLGTIPDVVAFLGIAIGLTAATNVTLPDEASTVEPDPIA